MLFEGRSINEINYSIYLTHMFADKRILQVRTLFIYIDNYCKKHFIQERSSL